MEGGVRHKAAWMFGYHCNFDIRGGFGHIAVTELVVLEKVKLVQMDSLCPRAPRMVVIQAILHADGLERMCNAELKRLAIPSAEIAGRRFILKKRMLDEAYREICAAYGETFQPLPDDSITFCQAVKERSGGAALPAPAYVFEENI